MKNYTHRQCSAGGRTTAHLRRLHDDNVLARAFAGDVTDEARAIATREIKAAMKKFRAEARGEFDSIQRHNLSRCAGYQRSAAEILAEVAQAKGDAAAITALRAEWKKRANAADEAADEARESCREAGKAWAEVEPLVRGNEAARDNYATAARMARLMALTMEVAA